MNDGDQINTDVWWRIERNVKMSTQLYKIRKQYRSIRDVVSRNGQPDIEDARVIGIYF
jgi:hypothetical protein